MASRLLLVVMDREPQPRCVPKRLLLWRHVDQVWRGGLTVYLESAPVIATWGRLCLLTSRVVAVREMKVMGEMSRPAMIWLKC